MSLMTSKGLFPETHWESYIVQRSPDFHSYRLTGLFGSRLSFLAMTVEPSLTPI